MDVVFFRLAGETVVTLHFSSSSKLTGVWFAPFAYLSFTVAFILKGVCFVLGLPDVNAVCNAVEDRQVDIRAAGGGR